MQIKNGLVFTKDGKFVKKNIRIENGIITEVSDFTPDSDAIDAAGKIVAPGYIDIHIHGADGSDCSDATTEALDTVAAYIAKQGVTSFCATTMSLSEETLSAAAEAVKTRMENPIDGLSKIRGINMEGPFFAMAKRGAQNPDFIIAPDYGFFSRVNEKSGNNIKLVDIAPELNGAEEFIRRASRDCVVSIAHTEADYDTSVMAFNAGVTHITHLFNAMPPFSHRAPGVIGAACDYANEVELISDGIHIHPSAIRSTFKAFGDDRICLISDAMRACGLPDGEYSLGGQPVFVKNFKATLADGTIAGAATNLAEDVRRAVSFGVPVESALKAATINPARAIGIDNIAGSIEEGKQADINIMTCDLVPEVIIIDGKIL